MSFVSLLPDNRTVLEDALGIATDPSEPVLADIEATRGFRYARPLNASVAPWLVLEYGLAPISAYFATVEDLIDQGREWQRIRGTPSAFHAALRWINYQFAAIEDQGGRGRRRWHLYQCAMGELPGASESLRLANAEYLGGISDPARSEFFRGWHGYDVRAMRWGRGRFGNTMWGDSSGVRIDGGNVKWSHGRSHTVEATGTIEDWAAFGWDDALADMVAASGTWSPSLAWITPMLYWSGTMAEAAVKTWLLMQRQAHLVFRDADGSPIGYARAIRKPVDNSAAALAPSVRYEIRTAFGDAAGATAASVGVVYDLMTKPDVKPCKSWLTPPEVVKDSGVEAGSAAWAHTFQKTVRETVELTLTVT